ncbi:MAG: TIGR02281 family clan AA aspartic protease, partial [Pseudomonadota bacterium]|nr:TIGR02281 family clan AA aspartic protease [Pseudomonadota bacterium]
MTNDLMLGGVYLLMAAMLMLGVLMSRREPIAKLLTLMLAWVAIFGAGFVLFTFRDDFGWVIQRLKAEALGDPVVQGRVTRIPMAIDGHFWVDAMLDGHRVKFLVDSGATMTTIDRTTARRAGIAISPQRDQYVRTGNGIIRVASGRVGRLAIGTIERRDMALEIADDDNLNVLGMNFLSSLSRWGVEGRWLVLVP